MLYFIVIILLFASSLFYFKIADKYNIVDKPNERSSHTDIALRGGGIIYWITALIYFLLHLKDDYLFFSSITMISFISFYDDIKNLSNKLRFAVHILVMTIAFYSLNIFELIPLWGIIIVYILSVGIINAYNFMDGINGITGLYSFVIFLLFLYLNEYICEFCDKDFIIFPILASMVFLFFNYRKKAKCFAGDIGSITVAFWIIYLLLILIMKTSSIVWLLFLAVYGVDTICTILHRLYLRQNIFEGHRLHYYQILCNERKMQHRVVSLIYALVQLGISSIIIFTYNKMSPIVIFIIILSPLILIYCTKFKWMKKV
jgi:UDP-N-acetylmuramyl pentapeptide phosphotransferase/UDP-N-acetylglucosamine-1-phosphate transferase